jgi:carbamoyl-phosphate synthase large subunit
VLAFNPISRDSKFTGMADEVYFLPVTPEFVTKVIEKERPTGILLSFGGQTALNCGISLYREGILEKYSVSVLGTSVETIIATEDRDQFGERLRKVGAHSAHGKTVTTLEDAIRVAKSIGFPVMVRAGYALGGAGSGLAGSEEELRNIATRALSLAPQLIVEESLSGWKELEYEVVRDREDNCIVVCTMENMDPVGIHTGESIVVAPCQTLNDEEYFGLRATALEIIRDLNIVGECNIQFALHPTKGTVRVIEVNARLSRSSALASKATGYPLAYVAAKLSVGKTLKSLKRNAKDDKYKRMRNGFTYFAPDLDPSLPCLPPN